MTLVAPRKNPGVICLQAPWRLTADFEQSVQVVLVKVVQGKIQALQGVASQEGCRTWRAEAMAAKHTQVTTRVIRVRGLGPEPWWDSTSSPHRIPCQHEALDQGVAHLPDALQSPSCNDTHRTYGTYRAAQGY